MLNVIQKLKTYGIKMKRFNLLKQHIEKKDMWLYTHPIDGLNYGKCGTPTGLKDIYGDSLFVGDVVKVFYRGERRPDFVSVVCENNNKQSIMGIFTSFLAADNPWIIRKDTCYTTIKHGTVIYDLNYMEK